jgi:predicted TPR repeat methyltransferase
MEPSQSSTRELTLEEAISLAILLQKHEQFVEAQGVYRRVLETSPDHPRALHFAGVLAHQLGRNDEALGLIERSLALGPDQADWYSNLGIVLQSQGRLDRAIDAYRRAIAIDPSHANAHNNLGVLLRATGQRPKHREARKLLAVAHCTLGEIGKAVSIFEEWLDEEPGNPIARHMLAACTGRDVPERASDGFIEATFDGFASSFEAKLQRLSYRAPALIGVMLEDSGLERSHGLDVLDAGCGTGLCGAIVAPFARRLVGVDLSQGMLAHAKEKHVYHVLMKAELTEYLRNHGEAFDLIVSADTLVYFGDLNGIIAALAGALRPNGLLVFTLEHAVADSPGIDHRLELHGRYSHARTYVEKLLTISGLQPEIIQADLRTEAGAPVPGLVIRATKSVSVQPQPPAHPASQ